MSATIINNDKDKIIELKSELFPNQDILNIQRLGGLTNHSYRVTLSNDDVVFRLAGEGTDALIDRQAEQVATKLASRLGIESDILYFDKEGTKISRYIENAITLSPETIKKTENIKLVAEVLSKLHHSGVDTGVVFDVKQTAEDYEAFIIKSGVPLFFDYQQQKDKVLEYISQYQLTHSAQVPCHNDPLSENWIRSGQKMYLIDWEYAGMNDPLWDVADVSIEAGYSVKEDQLLLETYYGKQPTISQRQRFVVNKIMIDYLWSLWGLTRVPFDDGMAEYASNRYQRMKRNIEEMEKI